MITLEQLRAVMPRLAEAKALRFLPHLNAAMHVHGVATLSRTAAFVAQLAHESGELRFMEELWGPTAAQRRYEPMSTLAQRLGNTQPGDGARFRGRGPIQITGRANYRRYGGLLGLDLEAQPEQAAGPDVGFQTAGLFWRSNGLNELADAEQFVGITRRINGGTNGLAERERYFERAKAVLQMTGFVAGPPPRTRGRAPAMTPPPPGLERGHEAIVEAVPEVARRAPRRLRSEPVNALPAHRRRGSE
jgi:predicted chitinase